IYDRPVTDGYRQHAEDVGPAQVRRHGHRRGARVARQFHGTEPSGRPDRQMGSVAVKAADMESETGMKGKADIKIIYEDNHLLVVEKPQNMLTQGDTTGDDDLLTLLKEDIRRRYNKPGNVYLGLVHRLDRPAGGVMVFAKTSRAASRLSEQVRTGTFGKTYLD